MDTPLDALSDITVFTHVVEAGTLTAAADALGVSVSAVSRSVSRLEKRLGASLLHRSTRALRPTPLGAQVYEQGLRVRDAASEIQSLSLNARQTPSGLLRVTAPSSLGLTWLSARLPGFRLAHPEVGIDLTLNDGHVNLFSEPFDLAIRITHNPPEGLVARHLFDFDFVLVAAEPYLARQGMPATPQSLAQHDVLFLAQRSFGERLSWAGGPASPTPGTVVLQRHLACNSSVLLTQMALRGQGIALVPAFVAQGLIDTGALLPVLENVRWTDSYRRNAVHAITPAMRHLPASTRRLVDYLREEGARMAKSL